MKTLKKPAKPAPKKKSPKPDTEARRRRNREVYGDPDFDPTNLYQFGTDPVRDQKIAKQVNGNEQAERQNKINRPTDKCHDWPAGPKLQLFDPPPAGYVHDVYPSIYQKAVEQGLAAPVPKVKKMPRTEEASLKGTQTNPMSSKEERTDARRKLAAAGKTSKTPGVWPPTTVEVEQAGSRWKVFGHPVTTILRWMGSDAWTEDDAAAVLGKLGIPDVKRKTIECQVRDGRKGTGHYGPIPTLTPGQAAALNAVLTPPVPSKPPSKPAKPRTRPGKGRTPPTPGKAGRTRINANAGRSKPPRGKAGKKGRKGR